jgi:hypothetical protein
MKTRLPLKPLDFAVPAVSLVLIVYSAFALYPGAESGARVVIRGSGRTWVFPLEVEERIAVPGPLGETVIGIGGGRAMVLSSPCANQTCVAAGHIHRPGNWTACLPNKVLVLIEKREDENGTKRTGNTTDTNDTNDSIDAVAW